MQVRPVVQRPGGRPTDRPLDCSTNRGQRAVHGQAPHGTLAATFACLSPSFFFARSFLTFFSVRYFCMAWIINRTGCVMFLLRSSQSFATILFLWRRMCYGGTFLSCKIITRASFNGWSLPWGFRMIHTQHIIDCRKSKEFEKEYR